MKLLLAILCCVAVVACIGYVARRSSNAPGYRRRFESRYRHDRSTDSASGSEPASWWMPTIGVGDAGGHHHGGHHGGFDAGPDCSPGSDGGGGGCGDGGSS